jgi:hypothetical protein
MSAEAFRTYKAFQHEVRRRNKDRAEMTAASLVVVGQLPRTLGPEGPPSAGPPLAARALDLARRETP